MPCQLDDISHIARHLPDYDNHEQVVRIRDPHSHLHCLIAVHNTARGPGVGGCRFWHYDSETDALADVLRLSAGMTYKNALAELPFGGGKAVILAPSDPNTDRNQLMTAFGQAVDLLHGAYCTAEDVGTSCDDMTIIEKQTPHIFGLANTSGDPSPFTAFGTYLGIQVAVAHRMNQHSLQGIHVAVQGVGNVGHSLCDYLHKAGARLTVSDVRPQLAARCAQDFGATVVDPDAIYDQPAHVYAPCALGATVNAHTLARLSTNVIAGAANNQLATEDLAAELSDRHILYAPDYVINAGGIINIACETDSYSRERALAEVAKIGPRLDHIFTQAREQATTTLKIANTIARKRLDNAADSRQSSQSTATSRSNA